MASRLTPNRLSRAERAKLIESVWPLAKKIAGRYRDRGLSWDDLESAALFGLTYAAMYFQPERGTKFTTYATFWVRAKIGRELNLHHRAGFTYAPKDAVMADRITPSIRGERECANPMDLLRDESPPVEPGEWDTWKRLLRHLLPEERRVVIGRFRDGRTLKSIGREMGFTREWTRQLEDSAIRRLRVAVARGHVPELLLEAV
jgi:RNA polymerase sigma factor (sigma-70 family)